MKIKKLTNLKWSRAMQKIAVLTAIFFCIGSVSAQADEISGNNTVINTIKDSKSLTEDNLAKIEESEKNADKKIEESPNAVVQSIESTPEKSRLKLSESAIKESVLRKIRFEPAVKDVADAEKPSEINDKEKFHWKAALLQSGIFLGIQHGFRMTQEKTTRELKGPFFRDWGQSVKNLRGWEDGDGAFTNYVAHPLQGATTGRIFVNNSDFARKQEFGKSKDYWESRFKAMIWSAVWSTQFELGPISEASVGNVGLNKVRGHSTMAYVDLVITPVVGTGVLVGEDAIDKYVLKNWLEKKYGNRTTVKLLRSFLTPTTSVTNLLRGKTPWKRDNR